MLKVKAGAYSVEAANPRHEHEWKVWKDVKLPDGKVLIPGVVSHASNVVEHPELVADRIVLYAGLVGRENVIAGTDCGLGLRVHPQICWAKLKALAEGAALASKQLWARRAVAVFPRQESPSVAGMVLPLRVTGQLGSVKINLAQVAGCITLRLVVKVLRFWIAAFAARRHRHRANSVAELHYSHEAVAAGSVPLFRTRITARFE